jgi:hypothetical protein
MPSGFGTSKPTKYKQAARGSGAFLEGYDGLAQALAIMLGATEDLRPVWPLYHRAFMDAERIRIESHGEGEWGRYSGWYAKWKATKHPGSGPFVITGATKASLVGEGPGHIYEPYPRYVKFGTTQPPAEYNYRKKGRHRRRVIDAKSPALMNELRKAVEEHAQAYARMWNGGRP